MPNKTFDFHFSLNVYYVPPQRSDSEDPGERGVLQVGMYYGDLPPWLVKTILVGVTDGEGDEWIWDHLED